MSCQGTPPDNFTLTPPQLPPTNTIHPTIAAIVTIAVYSSRLSALRSAMDGLYSDHGRGCPAGGGAQDVYLVPYGAKLRSVLRPSRQREGCCYMFGLQEEEET